MPFRYEFRFNAEPFDLDDIGRGIRCQFLIDYATAYDVQELANYPHQDRRAWARSLLAKYRFSGKTALDSSDFADNYGIHVRAACPAGATIICLEPNREDQDTTLVIQVLIFIFY